MTNFSTKLIDVGYFKTFIIVYRKKLCSKIIKIKKDQIGIVLSNLLREIALHDILVSAPIQIFIYEMPFQIGRCKVLPRPTKGCEHSQKIWTA